jgi:hypothetical protein
MHSLHTLHVINARRNRIRRQRKHDRQPAQITVGALWKIRHDLAQERKRAREVSEELRKEREFQHWRAEAKRWQAEAGRLNALLKLERQRTKRKR